MRKWEEMAGRGHHIVDEVMRYVVYWGEGNAVPGCILCVSTYLFYYGLTSICDAMVDTMVSYRRGDHV